MVRQSDTAGVIARQRSCRGNPKVSSLVSLGTSLILVLFSIGTSQTQRWVYRYNGPGNGSDEARSLAYGADGNIYAVGHSAGDFTAVSLTPTGSERWLYQYNSPGIEGGVAYSLVYGADGNIYTAGYSMCSGSGADFTVISLTSSGILRWVYRYNEPGNGGDEGVSLVHGGDGNIYVAGASGSSGSDLNLTIISLTSTGTQRWVYQYNGACNSWHGIISFNFLTYGADGNIYVAGASYIGGTSYEFTVISLSSTGTLRWVYWYNGPGNSEDWANSLVCGADSNLYVAGTSYGSGTQFDFTVISLTSTGSERWVYRYSGLGNYWDEATSIVYGDDGNVYVVGYIYGDNTNFDFLVISLSSAGTQRWISQYNGLENDQDVGLTLAYGSDENIYAAGYSTSSSTSADFIVISLSSAGTQRWIYQYNGPGNGSDCANSLVYGADGSIYAAGSSTGGGTSDDFTVISLNPALGIEEQTAIRIPLSAIRCFRNKIEFSLTLLRPANIPISVYNITGEKVLSFTINASAGTSHHQKDLSFLPTGVYIVKADIENRSISKKFVVVK